ncbi:MAG: aldehyde dehydrogenase [Klenkia sp.]|nr:aldehyde dehydrogenase [Klenkia sp.]
MAVYPAPGSSDSTIDVKPRYDNWIDGQWAPPATGEYFDNPTPVTGEVHPQVARGTAADIDAALDAAWAAAPA